MVRKEGKNDREGKMNKRMEGMIEKGKDET